MIFLSRRRSRSILLICCFFTYVTSFVACFQSLIQPGKSDRHFGLFLESRRRASTRLANVNGNEETTITKSAVASSSQSTTSSASTIPICEYTTVTIPTSYEGPPRQTVSTEDLTPIINRMIKECGIKNGFCTVISRHTTTAITINERESRLAQDMEEYFLTKLAPPDERSDSSRAAAGVRYYHNDINQRPDSEAEKQRCIDNGWDITDPIQLEKWRAQEPINAHSHLISMLLGSSECIPIQNGAMVLGQWQSVLLVDLDGPRDRTVGIQFMGFK